AEDISGHDPRLRASEAGGSSGIGAEGAEAPLAQDLAHGSWRAPERWNSADADDTAAGSQAADPEGLPREGAPHAGVPAKGRGVHAGLHHDTEEAQLGPAQGRQGAPHQRL